jgi:cytidylate kinase
MHSRLIIAIDGYSSCGKSTVAKALAKRLGLNYIDSGAMYRAVTFYFMQNDIPIPAPEELHDLTYNFESVLNDINISFALNQETGLSEVYLNGVNVEKEIRSMTISEQVSHVSAIKSVRHRMVQLQQKAGAKGGLVMDGRDIGTTVFPHADFKIFMKADPMVRAERRFKEMQTKGIEVTMPEVINNIVGRDYEDTHREESPLRKSPDAFILDNTFLSQNEQVEIVLKELDKLKEAAGTSFQ